MADVSASDIEAYVVGVINLDAATVAEVAPVAAQTAADFANLGMPAQSQFADWMKLVPAFRDRSIKYGLSVRLATYLARYEGTDKTAVQVLQEIITENTV